MDAPGPRSSVPVHGGAGSHQAAPTAGRSAADTEPQRQRVLLGAGRDGHVVERGAVAAGPGDALAGAYGKQQVEFLGEDVVVVVGVDAEEGEGFEEGGRRRRSVRLGR